MSRRVQLSLVLFLCAIGGFQAQTLEFVNALDNKKVEHVFVYSEERSQKLISNHVGEVDITALIPFDTLYFQHASFEPQQLEAARLESERLRIHLMPRVVQMPAFELKAAREAFLDRPRSVAVLKPEQIEQLQPRTAVELLEKSGELFVQRSQLGGGSPIIRGFEANRILLMLDGVRLNNAIYRSGHLQNAITIDPYLLERTEILYGPGSLIYGSDALGGVIHFHSKQPRTIEESGKPYSIQVGHKMSSATEEVATHWDMEVSGGRWASLSSFTRTEFGRLRMGQNRLHGDENWGLVPAYVQRMNGRDSIIQNPEAHKVPNWGYQQYDLAQKLKWQASDSASVLFNLQYSTSTDIPRSDQLTAYRNGSLRFAEWHYGPQERFLASLQFDVLSDHEIYDKAQIIAAIQSIGEDRISRSFQDKDRFIREEQVSVFSLNADMVKRLHKKDLYYGIETTSNTVRSDARIDNILSGESRTGPSRYPDGGSRMSTYGVYLDLKAQVSKKLEYEIGLRYSHAYLDSRYNDTSFYKLPFQSVIFDNGALTGSASLLWRPDKHWELGMSASTGFRSPNVDDYGKVFERSGIVIVPTDQLSAEYTLNGELRVGFLSEDQKLRLDMAGFYTHILDAIVAIPAQLNGHDSLLYEGEMARITVNANEQEALIYGLSAGLRWDFAPQWSLEAKGTKTHGELAQSAIPLAHIPPFYGKFGIEHSRETFHLGGYLLYNDTKTAKTVAPGRTDNAAEGLQGGFPSWYTAHLYLGIEPMKGMSLRLFMDNITDIHYKAFASGVSAPGRSLGFDLRYRI